MASTSGTQNWSLSCMKGEKFVMSPKDSMAILVHPFTPRSSPSTAWEYKAGATT